MRALITSDNQPVATRLRQALLSNGVDCPLANVVSLERVHDTLAAAAVPHDLIFVVLSPDADAAITTLEQLRVRSRARLCAVGAARDPREILRVVHTGPTDYLDENGDLGEQVGSLLNRLLALDRAEGDRGVVLSVVSPCGGSGCTTLAANLAVALAEQHDCCALCDFDLRTGDIVSMFNLKPSHSIIEVCSNLRALDDELFDRALLKHDSGVHVLAAPQRYSEVQQVTPEAAQEVVRIASQAYPYVVADLEDFFHREQYQVLLGSDRVLIAFRLEFTALRNIRRTLEYLLENGVDRRKIDLVVNQFGRPREISLQQAEKALGRKVNFLIPDDPKVVIPAADRGVPAVLDVRRSRFARAVRQMAEEITVPAAVS
jgi:pilus assembly protein CpaE